MLPGDSEEKHGTEMKDILIMHFIAESHTNSRCRFTGVVAAARSRAKLHHTIDDLMRPNIIHERYRFARKHGVLCFTIGCI